MKLELEKYLKQYFHCKKLIHPDKIKNQLQKIVSDNSLKLLGLKKSTYEIRDFSKKKPTMIKKPYTVIVLGGTRKASMDLFYNTEWQQFMQKYQAILDETIPTNDLDKK